MGTKRINEHEGDAFDIALGPRDDLVELLYNFAREKSIAHCHFTAMGSFSNVELLGFEPETKEYREISTAIPSDEILTLGGSLGFKGEKPHVHVVIARADGTAQGGHLAEASVEGSAELALISLPEEEQPAFDEEPYLLPIT